MNFNLYLSLIELTGEDKRLILWHIDIPAPVINAPMKEYHFSTRPNQVQWGAVHPDWMAICRGRTMELLPTVFLKPLFP